MDHSKKLKTTFDLVREALQTRNNAVVENENVDGLQINYNQKTMLEEKDGLHQAFYEPEVLNADLEKRRKKLDSWYKKLKDMKNELKTKMDETDDLEKLNQALVVKERQCHDDELQEARKELIKYLAQGEHVIRVFDEEKVVRGSDLKFNKDLMTEVGKLKMKLKEYKVLVIFIVCALFFIMFIPRNW